jgi:hypothetical protein
MVQTGGSYEERNPRRWFGIHLSWRDSIGLLLLVELGIATWVLLALWPSVAHVPAAPVPAGLVTTTTTSTATTSTTAGSTTTTTTTVSGTTTKGSPTTTSTALPVVSQAAASGQTTPSSSLPGVSLFGFHWNHPDPDLLYIAAVLALGALGSALHALTSYASFRGHGTFESPWGWWYLIRLPLGSGVALVLYFVMRAGLLSTATSTGSVSPYGIGAVAALAGLFSHQAIDKLRETFEAIFPPKVGAKPNNGGGKGPSVDRIFPDPLPPDTLSPRVTLEGTGFTEGVTATINKSARTVTVLDPTRAEIALQPEDMGVSGEKSLVLSSPGPAGVSSKPVLIRIGAVPTRFSQKSPPSEAAVGAHYGPYQFISDGVPTPVYTAAGQLPPGLHLDTNGILSGEPSTWGTYTFTVTGTNPFGSVNSGVVTITVSAT